MDKDSAFGGAAHGRPRESDAMDVTEQELARRKAFLEIGDEDVANLTGINDLARRHAEAVIEDFYRHLLSFDETRAFFGHAQLLQRVRGQQKDYFLRLTQGNYDLAYMENRLRIASVDAQPVADARGRVVKIAGTLRDITDQRLVEEQLVQAQKMEAIGNLTGGMAHDFNNLLGVIIGNLDLLREQHGGNPEIEELAREALDAATRGAELTRGLLAFARRQPLQPKRIAINDVVTAITRLLRRTLGERVKVTLDLDADVWPVIADPAQLEAALANLATNARDAMPKGGGLTIATSNERLDADYAARFSDVAPGG